MRKNWLKIPVFSAVLVLTASFVAQAQQSWKLNEGAWRCYEDGVVHRIITMWMEVEKM